MIRSNIPNAILPNTILNVSFQCSERQPSALASTEPTRKQPSPTREAAQNRTQPRSAGRTEPSREAAQECSPRRQPWVIMQQPTSPEGATDPGQEQSQTFRRRLCIPS